MSDMLVSRLRSDPETLWEEIREILHPSESALQSREDKIAKAREFLAEKSFKTGRIYKFRRQ